jgi:hypothetical protein
MRWNTRERTIGGCVAATGLLVAFLLPSPAALLIRPGMTRPDAEAVLGRALKQTTFSDWFPSPGMTAQERTKSLQEFSRTAWMIGYDYESFWGVVNVTYHAPGGRAQVQSVESRSVSSLVVVGYLALAASLGAVAAEVVRRRRAVPAGAVAARL